MSWLCDKTRFHGSSWLHRLTHGTPFCCRFMPEREWKEKKNSMLMGEKCIPIPSTVMCSVKHFKSRRCTYAFVHSANAHLQWMTAIASIVACNALWNAVRAQPYLMLDDECYSMGNLGSAKWDDAIRVLDVGVLVHSFQYYENTLQTKRVGFLGKGLSLRKSHMRRKWARKYAICAWRRCVRRIFTLYSSAGDVRSEWRSYVDGTQ